MSIRAVFKYENALYTNDKKSTLRANFTIVADWSESECWLAG